MIGWNDGSQAYSAWRGARAPGFLDAYTSHLNRVTCDFLTTTLCSITLFSNNHFPPTKTYLLTLFEMLAGWRSILGLGLSLALFAKKAV